MSIETFKIFDPFTGGYVEYPLEADARRALLNIAQQVIRQNEFSIIHSIKEENGSEKWSATPVTSFVVVDN